eukprot:Nk52_evm12s273 gene=Nk52_evmTU12s273
MKIKMRINSYHQQRYSITVLFFLLVCCSTDLASSSSGDRKAAGFSIVPEKPSVSCGNGGHIALTDEACPLDVIVDPSVSGFVNYYLAFDWVANYTSTFSLSCTEIHSKLKKQNESTVITLLYQWETPKLNLGEDGVNASFEYFGETNNTNGKWPRDQVVRIGSDELFWTSILLSDALDPKCQHESSLYDADYSFGYDFLEMGKECDSLIIINRTFLLSMERAETYSFSGLYKVNHTSVLSVEIPAGITTSNVTTNGTNSIAFSYTTTQRTTYVEVDSGTTEEKAVVLISKPYDTPRYHKSINVSLFSQQASDAIANLTQKIGRPDRLWRVRTMTSSANKNVYYVDVPNNNGFSTDALVSMKDDFVVFDCGESFSNETREIFKGADLSWRGSLSFSYVQRAHPPK